MDSEAVLYMVRAECPNCGESVRHVSEVETPISLDRDAPIPDPYCPACGVPIVRSEWDVQAEHEVERVLPIQERGER